MKRAVIVGSGAGGATVAKELQGRYQVTVLEAGQQFRPFGVNLTFVERTKQTGLLFDERAIQLLFPAMQVRRTPDRMVLVNGVGVGGTTTICAGNAMRLDQDLRAAGIDLDDEFKELQREVPITTEHRSNWSEVTRRLFDICEEMALAPEPTPKMGDYERCANCGRCVLGCPYGVKWDSRRFLDLALDHGASLVTGCKVTRIVTQDREARGVEAQLRGRQIFYPADLVVVAAGGLGTPIILQDSGIKCVPGLSVDPVLTVAARWTGSRQNTEMTMPFIVRKPGYMLSPYFDFLSFFFNRRWRHRAQHTLGLMIKLADANQGSISAAAVQKTLTTADRATLTEAVGLCTDVLGRLGIDPAAVELGTVNAGHPGGMLPLSQTEAAGLHHSHLPNNLYVADASLLPRSLGGPPILTIMAIAKRVSRICSEFA